MPVPDFLRALRARVGHDLVWMPGVRALVVDDSAAAPRLLLMRRADSGAWATIAGILEPGEDPAAAIVREIAEETTIAATVDRLLSVRGEAPVRYPNGDLAQYLTMTFLCRASGGAPRPGDDEALEVRWFGLDELPAGVAEHLAAELELARRPAAPAFSGVPAGAPERALRPAPGD